MKIIIIFSILFATGCAHYSRQEMNELRVAVENNDAKTVSKNVKDTFNQDNLLRRPMPDDDSKWLVDSASKPMENGACRNVEILKTLLRAEAIIRCTALMSAANAGCVPHTEILLKAVEPNCVTDATRTFANHLRESSGDGLSRNSQIVFNLFKSRLNNGCKQNTHGFCSTSKELDQSLVDAREIAANKKHEKDEEARVEKENRDREAAERQREIEQEKFNKSPAGIKKEFCAYASRVNDLNAELDRENKIAKRTGFTDANKRYGVGQTLISYESQMEELQAQHRKLTGNEVNVADCKKNFAH